MKANLSADQYINDHNAPLAEPEEMYEQMSDLEVIAFSQCKNMRAFKELANRKKKHVAELLKELAPDWEDISDLTQEVFLRVWRSIDKLRNPRAFMSWLQKLVLDLYYDEARKRSKTKIISIDNYNKLEYLKKANRHDINKAIQSLPEQHRTALILSELGGLPFDLIADIMNLSTETVRSIVVRARTQIYASLNYKKIAC